MPPLTSVLHNKEKVIEAIAVSNSQKEVLLYLGLRAAGGNYKGLQKACKEMGLELPKHDYTMVPFDYNRQLSNEDVFVENSAYHNRTGLKKRMFELGFLNECSCGQGPEWKGKPMTLTLEHKNGVWNDNRIENLEILCPNCHSQTETFAGKNSKKIIVPQPRPAKIVLVPRQQSDQWQDKPCISCPNLRTYGSKSGRCADCARKLRYTTVYPNTETLVAMVKEKGFVAVAADLGVSDNAVRKHLKKTLPSDHPIFRKVAKKRG